MKLILTLALLLSWNTNAHASTASVELEGIQAALDARNEFVQALQDKKFFKIAHDGLERAIKTAVEDLKKNKHDDAMAQELWSKWEASQARFFAIATLEDLGDHEPLLPWLEAFFQKMANKYGDIIFKLPYVQDLRDLNFAIPVTFQPHGKWQKAGENNRVEYRKHFIPFANIVTYYVALYSCNAVVVSKGMPNLKKLCGWAAKKLRWAMGRYIAPAIADYIFKETNRIEISKEMLHYMTAEQLRAAIKKGN